MIFRSTKKLKRDRKLGLVFRWSGSYASNRGGMTVAFLLTSGLFAMMFFGLQLEVESRKGLSTHEPKIILVSNPNEELERWIELQSPRLPKLRADGELGRDRVSEMLSVAVDKVNAESLDWREVDFTRRKLQPTPRALAGIRELPAVKRHQLADEQVEVAPAKWRVQTEVEGELGKRLKADQVFLGKIAKQWQGRSIAFLITVNQDGVVEHCTPLKNNGEKEALNFENWTRALQFKSSEKSTQQGVVRLYVVERKADD